MCSRQLAAFVLAFLVLGSTTLAADVNSFTLHDPNIDIRVFFQKLARSGHINILVADDVQGPISVSFEKADPEAVLASVARSRHLTAAIIGGGQRLSFFVGTEAQLRAFYHEDYSCLKQTLSRRGSASTSK